MDIKKALLVKSLKGLLAITQLVSVTTTNASHRYPRGRYQYKYTYRSLKVLLKTAAYSQISKNKIHFLR